MGKKGSGWFSSVKRAFKSSSKDNSSDNKKANVGNWHHETPEVVSVDHFPAESSATSSPPVNEEQHTHAVTMATAEAAEAAIAAAQAVAKVVRLSGYRRHAKEEKAAVFIQSYYRGYLARRALRALKGLVRLQALVRGHSVRRQAQMTMRCMQALVRVQARVKARRLELAHERLQKEADRELLEQFKVRRRPLKDLDLECWNERRHESFDQAMERPYKMSDAHMKRERALAYAYNYKQQKFQTLQSDPLIEDASLYNNFEKPPSRQNWLGTWVTSQPQNNETRNPNETSNLTTFTSTDDASVRTVEMDTFTITPPKTQEFTNIYKLKPSETETETNRSPHIPSYMSPTQSAKAKVRIQGQPTTKQRSLSVSTSPWNNSTKRGGSSPLASGCDSSSLGAYRFGHSPSPLNQGVYVQQERKVVGFSSDSSVNSFY